MMTEPPTLQPCWFCHQCWPAYALFALPEQHIDVLPCCRVCWERIVAQVARLPVVYPTRE